MIKLCRLIFIFLILSSSKILASCWGESFSSLPNAKVINRNGIVILNIPKSMGFCNSNIKLLKLRLFKNDSKELKFEQRLISGGNTFQVIINPENKFNLNDSIYLSCELNDSLVWSIKNDTRRYSELENRFLTPKQISACKDYLQSIYWKTNNIIDNYKPKWITKVIKNTTENSLVSCSRGYAIVLYPKAIDRLSEKKFVGNKNILLEIVYEDQTTIIAGDEYFALSFSNCSSNCRFAIDKLCKFTIKLLDYSGNYSSETVVLSITPKSGY